MTALRIRASSQAEEAGFLAMRDLAIVAADVGIDYRLVGGQMVRLHVALADVPEPVVPQDAEPGQARQWRLLRAHRQRVPGPVEWRESGVQGDAATTLRADFARPAGSGVRAATTDRAEQAEIRALTLSVLRT